MTDSNEDAFAGGGKPMSVKRRNATFLRIEPTFVEIADAEDKGARFEEVDIINANFKISAETAANWMRQFGWTCIPPEEKMTDKNKEALEYFNASSHGPTSDKAQQTLDAIKGE